MNPIGVVSLSSWAVSDAIFDVVVDESTHDLDGQSFYGNDPSRSKTFPARLASRIKQGLRTAIVGSFCDHRLVGNIVATDTKRLTSFRFVIVASENAKVELAIGVISCLARNGFYIEVVVIDDGHWPSIKPDYDLCVKIKPTLMTRDELRRSISTQG